MHILQVLAVAVLAASGAAQACTIDIALTNQGTPPYIGAYQPDPARPGLAVDIVRAAAASIGCEARFAAMPGKRVLATVAAGQYDAALMYSHTPERAAQMVYPMVDHKPDGSKRLARLQYYFYRGPNSKMEWDGTRLSHIDGAVGVNLGFSVAATVRELGAKVEEVATTEQNLEKLRLGRLAAFAMHDTGIDPWLRLPAYARIERLPIPISTRDYFLAYSPAFYKQQRELAERLWTAIGVQRDKVTAERASAYAR